MALRTSCVVIPHEVKDLNNRLGDQAYEALEKFEEELLYWRKDDWDFVKAEQKADRYANEMKNYERGVKINPDCKPSVHTPRKLESATAWLELDGNDERLTAFNRKEKILIKQIQCHKEYHEGIDSKIERINTIIRRTDWAFEGQKEASRYIEEHTLDELVAMCLDPTLEDYERVMRKIEDLYIPYVSWVATVFDWFYDTEADDIECADKYTKLKKQVEDRRLAILPE